MPVMRNITTHFSRNPVTIDRSRSTFDESNNLLTSFKVGDLIPIYCDPDILPGDTIKVSTTSLLRMATPIFPVMDNAYLDYFWFFTPNRIPFTQWPEFMGEADPSAYDNPSAPVYPTVQVTPAADNLAGYFGLPLGKTCTVSAIPFRDYRIIWNEWFRDQNTQDYATVSKAAGTDVNNYTTILKANKYKDWFTSALPSPQKGVAVNILQSLSGVVQTSATMTGSNSIPMKFTQAGFQSGIDGTPMPYFMNVTSTTADLSQVGDFETSLKDTVNLGGPYNMYVNLPAMSVNALRLAVQTQRLLELDARGGSRYIEQIYSHFGVRSPDARLQRPEYLGGGHVTINMMQVLQQSANADEPTPIGTVSAYSKTVHSKYDFERSFTEHGCLMCLACVRTALSYQQGIEPGWLRTDRYDFYYPTLANIGEQPIYNKYLYYQGNSADDEVFGYGEAWADYRTKRSHITGLLNSKASGTLDAWHYGENFTQKPTLSAAFIQQGRAPFLRSLAVQDQDDFIANFYFEMYYTRVMPTYSIPGLVDHF